MAVAAAPKTIEPRKRAVRQKRLALARGLAADARSDHTASEHGAWDVCATFPWTKWFSSMTWCRRMPSKNGIQTTSFFR